MQKHNTVDNSYWYCFTNDPGLLIYSLYQDACGCMQQDAQLSVVQAIKALHYLRWTQEWREVVLDSVACEVRTPRSWFGTSMVLWSSPHCSKMAAKGPNIMSSHYSTPVRKAERGQKGCFSHIFFYYYYGEKSCPEVPSTVLLIGWIESLAMGKRVAIIEVEQSYLCPRTARRKLEFYLARGKRKRLSAS